MKMINIKKIRQYKNYYTSILLLMSLCSTACILKAQQPQKEVPPPPQYQDLNTLSTIDKNKLLSWITREQTSIKKRFSTGKANLSYYVKYMKSFESNLSAKEKSYFSSAYNALSKNDYDKAIINIQALFTSLFKANEFLPSYLNNYPEIKNPQSIAHIALIKNELLKARTPIQIKINKIRSAINNVVTVKNINVYKTLASIGNWEKPLYDLDWMIGVRWQYLCNFLIENNFSEMKKNENIISQTKANAENWWDKQNDLKRALPQIDFKKDAFIALAILKNKLSTTAINGVKSEIASLLTNDDLNMPCILKIKNHNMKYLADYLNKNKYNEAISLTPRLLLLREKIDKFWQANPILSEKMPTIKKTEDKILALALLLDKLLQIKRQAIESAINNIIKSASKQDLLKSINSWENSLSTMHGRYLYTWNKFCQAVVAKNDGATVVLNRLAKIKGVNNWWQNNVKIANMLPKMLSQKDQLLALALLKTKLGYAKIKDSLAVLEKQLVGKSFDVNKIGSDLRFFRDDWDKMGKAVFDHSYPQILNGLPRFAGNKKLDKLFDNNKMIRAIFPKINSKEEKVLALALLRNKVFPMKAKLAKKEDQMVQNSAKQITSVINPIINSPSFNPNEIPKLIKELKKTRLSYKGEEDILIDYLYQDFLFNKFKKSGSNLRKVRNNVNKWWENSNNTIIKNKIYPAILSVKTVFKDDTKKNIIAFAVLKSLIAKLKRKNQIQKAITLTKNTLNTITKKGRIKILQSINSTFKKISEMDLSSKSPFARFKEFSLSRESLNKYCKAVKTHNWKMISDDSDRVWNDNDLILKASNWWSHNKANLPEKIYNIIEIFSNGRRLTLAPILSLAILKTELEDSLK